MKTQLINLALALVAALLVGQPALAQSLKIVARFAPEDGRIVDAALLDGQHLILLYPDAGRLADYTLDGQLHQHIVREGGAERRFRPLACIARSPRELLVFDEAAHKVFFIGADGNISRGVDLAYPSSGGTLLALSRVGDLAVGGSDVIWAMLPETNTLAGFDLAGNYVTSLALGELLPYAPAIYTRAQLFPDGSLYLLEYHQGAVIYRHGPDGAYRRLRLNTADGGTVLPELQDFAVDDAGNVLLVTHDEQSPLQLLTPGGAGYAAHPVDLDLPGGNNRLACRWSGGMFILWTRDKPEVIVLQLQP
ncbi:hypothetical protein JW859_13465 [bacterium]|nr:hypothetical protein [bacterium]